MNFKLYDNIKEYVNGYLYNIDKPYYLEEGTMIKNELKSLYGYTDDGISWITPDRNYIFKILRTDNDKVSYYHYFVDIDVYSILNSLICKIRLNEYNIVEILSNISKLFDLNQYNRNANIITIPGMSINEFISININATKCGDMISNNNDINFKIISTIDNDYHALVNINMSYLELREFCFRIFFYTLIDADLNVSEDILDDIQAFVSY